MPRFSAPSGNLCTPAFLPRVLFLLGALVFALLRPEAAFSAPKSVPERPEPSAMGSLFRGLVPWPADFPDPRRSPKPAPFPQAAAAFAPLFVTGGEVNVTPGALRFQSETTIAVRGDTVVVGFNDVRGFFLPNLSVSGFAYSHDGGLTFTDGGQLPTLGGDQIRGDPDLKMWVNPATGRATWIYSSLYRPTSGGFSLCVHVSTNGGATWSAPRVATPVTSATLFPDKEFIDVDPETGRIVMSWTSFGATVDMRVTTSSDLGLTWTPVVIFSARANDGQGSCPRFDPTSNGAYIVWRAFDPAPVFSFVRSLDNGLTWSVPADIVTSGVSTPLPPYGSDRINGYPSLDVSPTDGSLHMVYANQSSDFGDVFYTRSVNQGSSWSTPVALNSNPGSDRAQFFPWIYAGDDGGLDVLWYDQASGTAGSDLTETMYAHSEDGGVAWSCPMPFTRRPFHAEYGQDSGQPNLGDYNQVASRLLGSNRIVFASYARTDTADVQTLYPDTHVAFGPVSPAGADAAFAGVAVTDLGCEADGFLVADEFATLTLTLRNRCRVPLTGVAVTLATSTPGVMMPDAFAAYPAITAGGTASNGDALSIRLADTFPSGRGVELSVSGTSDQGAFRFDFTLPTGVVRGRSVLLAEDFESVAVGLPSGWTSLQFRGVANPWHVSSALASSGSKSVFCVDWPDTNWSRLQSPSFVVPAGTDLVEVTFAVTYDCEDVDDGRQGYDGALLRINVDGTDILAGAFPTLFEGQYRTQIVRSSGPTGNALQDLSAWSGSTLPDFESIRIQYPGLAGKTLRLIYDMAADGSVGGTGIYVDDIEVQALDLGTGSCTAAPALAVAPAAVLLPPAGTLTTVCRTVTLHNPGTGFLDVLSVTGCTSGDFSLDLTGLQAEVFPGDSTSFRVCATGPTLLDTCRVAIATNAGNDTVLVRTSSVLGVADPVTAWAPLSLGPLRPNPLWGRGVLQFAVGADGPVWAEVYSLAGGRVRTLSAGAVLSAGTHVLEWDGRGDDGTRLGNGIYFIRVRAAAVTRTVKAVLLGS